MLRQSSRTIQSHSRRAAFRLGLPWSRLCAAARQIAGGASGPEVAGRRVASNASRGAGAAIAVAPRFVRSNCGAQLLDRALDL